MTITASVDASSAAAQSPVLDYSPPAAMGTPVTPRRNEGIDVIRFFAATGIVFVHTVQSDLFLHWGHFFRFAVPFFLFASLYYQTLSFRRKPDVTFSSYAVGRFFRLYMPFLVWSAVYLGVRDVKRMKLTHLGPAKLTLSMIWKGTEYHLWFLPYLLVASILLCAVHKFIIQKRPNLRWTMIGLALAAGVVACYFGKPNGSGEDYSEPAFEYFQWRINLPATFWAMAFAWAMAAGPMVYRISSLVGWGGLALAFTCSVWQAVHDIALFPRAMTGLGCMLAALSPWKQQLWAGVAKLGRRGYGIYLCHVLPIEIVKAITNKKGFAHTPALDVAVFAVSFVAAVSIALLLDRSKKTAWLNGG
jgi:peptidoglycan/LPS O-acetylase OafA/YrhL